MENFNADELEAPKWMNDEFFKGVLVKCEENNSISIRDVKITPATVKGDHYASVMFRATVAYDTNKAKGIVKPLIIKTMPELDGVKKELLQESHIFETEISMYSKTIPQMEAELRKVGDNTQLGAKALYYSLEPRKCIIFEDIVPKGYETVRDRLANMEETKLALLKLAKWHAVSYKLAAEGDKSVTKYRDHFMHGNIEGWPMIVNGFNNFIEKIESLDDLKGYAPKLKALKPEFIKKTTKLFTDTVKGEDDGILVLCHGDFHVKNMMFKRSKEGKLEDVLLVDYQVCFYGPAVLDIIYAFMMLINEDLRKNHQDEIIHYYVVNFIETLKKLNFKGKLPTVTDFLIDVIKKQRWELFLFINFLPMWYAMSSGGKVEPEEFMTSCEAQRKLCDNEEFVKEVRRLLPIYLHKGSLE